MYEHPDIHMVDVCLHVLTVKIILLMCVLGCERESSARKTRDEARQNPTNSEVD
jgi:hypothetical protein